MARTLRKAPKPRKRALPMMERELHSPITSLGRGAVHMRLRPESTYRNPTQADFACRIMRNLSMVVPAGSTPLSARFSRMLG